MHELRKEIEKLMERRNSVLYSAASNYTTAYRLGYVTGLEKVLELISTLEAEKAGSQDSETLVG